MDSVGCPMLSMRLYTHLGVHFVSGFILSQSQSCQHLGGGAQARALRPKALLLSSESRTPLPPGPTPHWWDTISYFYKGQAGCGMWVRIGNWMGGKGSAQAQLLPQGACKLLLSPLPQAPCSHLSRYLCCSSSNPVLPFAPSLYRKPALGRAVSYLLQRTPTYWCCALCLPDLWPHPAHRAGPLGLPPRQEAGLHSPAGGR